MIHAFDPKELDRFRNIIAGHFGLDIDERKLDFLAGALERRLDACGGLSAADYLDQLSTSCQGEEMQALAGEITVAETYFFRGSEQCQALSAATLPERIRVRSAMRRLRLLSAGCASGEEAYSLAIILRENFPELRSWNIEIRGIDVNPAVLEKARKGRYSAWALRETPPEIRDKYFRVIRGEYQLDDQIRSMVSFEERNLAAAKSCSFPGEGGFDIILCRNVLMYFVQSVAQQAVDRMTQALAADGYLFLGYAETLRGLSQKFQLQHTHNSFYYQKSGTCEEMPPSPGPRCDAPASPPRADVSWINAIQRTCGRIDCLAHSPAIRPQDPAGSLLVAAPLPPPVRPMELGMAFELLSRERFHEALNLLDGLSLKITADPDVRLLRAVLLTNAGDPETAEGICRELLSTDDLNASAHYVMALCREQAGEVSEAMEHDRAAIHLDPTFAIPHLHLGRLAKRKSNLTLARYELQQAVALLLREDAARILLFGGGFSREALLAFSKAEILDSGGVL